MHRSFAWGMIAIMAIVLAPFAGAFGVPAGVVHAAPAAQIVPPRDDEIIVITTFPGGALGPIRVDDPNPQAGYQPATWSSSSETGWETGWTLVAGGDFNNDGDAELVAAKGSVVKVFDPFVQPDWAKVNFDADLGSGKNVKLLVTGNFDDDPKDEFAVIYAIGTGAGLAVYDGGLKATANEWTQRTPPSTYGAMFRDMSVGDFNADGVDDLVMVRNAGSQYLVTALNVKTWATIAEGLYTRPWYAVAGGNLSTSTPGDEISLTRDGYNAAVQGLILFKVVSGKFADLVTNSLWRWNPDFTSLANGDLNGDGDDEVVMLRDPTVATTSLLMVNPANPVNPPPGWLPPVSFEQATGYGSSAFRIVRTGDTDGDGRDEIVILRAATYYLYYQPEIDYKITPTAGSYYTPGSVSNLPFMALANVDGDGIPTGPVLGVTPTSLPFSLNCGDTSPQQDLTISNSGAGSSIDWQAQAIEDQVVAGGPWLLLSKTSGTTQDTVKVSVRTGVPKGNYAGKVQVTTTNPDVQIKTVDVAVSYAQLCSGFVVTPTTLERTVPWGSTELMSVAISAPGPTGWTASVLEGGDWLTLSPTSGTTPSTLNITINPNAAGTGVHSGTIKITSATPLPNSPQSVYVTLTVPDPGFVVTPSALTIRQRSDFSTIVTGQVKIERPNGGTTWKAGAVGLVAAGDLEEKLANGQATVTAEGVIIDGVLLAPPAWLVFDPSQGGTPETMRVSVAPNTSRGTYRAVITILPGDASLPAKMVDVTAIVAGSFTYLPLVIK